MKNYLFAAAFLMLAMSAHAQNIITIAGNGTQGYSGDGGQATAAELYYPAGIFYDQSSNIIYVADSYNNVVRTINTAGVVTTIAGNGTGGYSGDGGPATAAMLSAGPALAKDKYGNLYIADVVNYRIRKVTPAGIISTIAGNGTSGYTGDGGPATAAEMTQPAGLAIDTAGNIYFADELNNRVRKIDPSGNIITIAGNGIAGFSGDGGSATAAMLNEPTGIAIDQQGNLYIADDNRLRKVNSSGIITTICGNGNPAFGGDGGPATAAEIRDPTGIAVYDEQIFFTDRINQRIRKVSATDTITTIAGDGSPAFSGDGGPATAAALHDPNGISIDNYGNIYIADVLNNRVREVVYRAAGVKNVTGGIAINVYPNPVSEVLHIDLEAGSSSQGQTYSVRNIYGAIVLQGALQIGSNSVSVAALPVGIYMVMMSDDGERTIRKIIKSEH